MRRRQLETPATPPARHGLDWHRLPLYAGIAMVALLLWNAGALRRLGLSAVDEATRVNSPATGGAPLALLAFTCGATADATMVARGEVQNRLTRPVTLEVDLAWTDRGNGIDTIRHTSAALAPQSLPSLAIGHFEIALPESPSAIADCHVAAIAERGSAPIRFDDVHG